MAAFTLLNKRRSFSNSIYAITNQVALPNVATTRDAQLSAAGKMKPDDVTC